MNLTSLVAGVMQQPDAESRIEGLLKLAWTEGAYAGLHRLSIQQIEDMARAKPDA